MLAEGNNHVIAIENKIKSSLHGIDKREEISQLTKYVQFIEKEFDGKKETHYFLFEPNYNEIDIAYFDKGAGGVKFQPVCYLEIYRFFKKHIDAFKSGEHGQYADCLLYTSRCV